MQDICDDRLAYCSLVPIIKVDLRMRESLGDQTAAEPQSGDHQQASSSNNEKHHNVPAAGKGHDRKRKKKQGGIGEANDEKQDENEAGFGDYFVSLRLPIELESS